MQTKWLGVVLGMAGLGFTGCSSDGTDPGGGGAPDAGAGTTTEELLAAPDPADGFQLALDATIQAGEEVTYCKYEALPAGEFDLQKFESRYSAGSHHLLVFSTGLAPSEVDLDAPAEVCGVGGEGVMARPGFGIVYGAQDPSSGLEYPVGVAKHVEANTIVLLQAHYLNSSDQPVDAQVRLNAYYAKEPVTQYADSLFYYNYAIYIPANGTGKARMRCVVPEDITVMGAASHAHRRLTHYRAELALGGDLANKRMLYETDKWENVDPAVYAPFEEIKAGEIIEFECEYQNDRDEVTTQGPSADKNEMCMFVASYYPQMDLLSNACFVEGSGPIGSGTKTCGETLSCLTSAQGDEATQKCMTDICERSSVSFGNIVTCGAQKCASGAMGGAMGGADLGCVLQECAAELTACQATTCD